ncbi:MAG: right-handed parallel beta-helix repeat-containing protein [Bacteroidetes bacterium]|nr:right-handed parallel beta-helix repeat-containing protein [Bacteroidota bacterium]
MKTIFQYLLLCFTLMIFSIHSNAIITKSIKDFGAKGNGIINDQAAFEKAAAFIQKNGGNVKLLIPKGVYMVGKQIRSNTPNRYLIETNVFSLSNCNNVLIQATGKASIKYVNNLKFGTFNPENGAKLVPEKLPFYDMSKTAQLGCLFMFQNCNNIQVSGFEADGNNLRTIIGGSYGDKGIQLWHYGIHLTNCKQVLISNMNVHHFCLDGILVKNPWNMNCNVKIMNSIFDYNGRQGLSWVGGRGLQAVNCSFSHTGKANIYSSPGAGVDIEAEDAEIKEGVFEKCKFFNNTGAGLLASDGKSEQLKFVDCTFWGTTFWSAWVNKPDYSFYSCNFFGSFVHGYVTDNFQEATKFYKCLFQDSTLAGKTPYGQYLLECDSRKLMVFDSCQFIYNHKKLMWYNGVASAKNDDKPIFNHCVLLSKGKLEVYNSNNGKRSKGK